MICLFYNIYSKCHKVAWNKNLSSVSCKFSKRSLFKSQACPLVPPSVLLPSPPLHAPTTQHTPIYTRYAPHRPHTHTRARVHMYPSSPPWLNTLDILTEWIGLIFLDWPLGSLCLHCRLCLLLSEGILPAPSSSGESRHVGRQGMWCPGLRLPSCPHGSWSAGGVTRDLPKVLLSKGYVSLLGRSWLLPGLASPRRKQESFPRVTRFNTRNSLPGSTQMTPA